MLSTFCVYCEISCTNRNMHAVCYQIQDIAVFPGVPSPKWGLKKPCQSCRTVPTTQSPTKATSATLMTKATSKYTTVSPATVHTTQAPNATTSTTSAPATVSATPITTSTSSMYKFLFGCYRALRALLEYF